MGVWGFFCSVDRGSREKVDVSNIQKFNGVWKGNGEQTDGRTWSLKIKIDNKAQNYILEFPSLGCTGVLTLLSANNNNVEFRHELISGKCINYTKINLTINNNELTFKSYSKKKLVGWGTLKK